MWIYGRPEDGRTCYYYEVMVVVDGDCAAGR